MFGGDKDETAAKYAFNTGTAVTNFALTVRTGLLNRMLPGVYAVGEQNAMYEFVAILYVVELMPSMAPVSKFVEPVAICIVPRPAAIS